MNLFWRTMTLLYGLIMVISCVIFIVVLSFIAFNLISYGEIATLVYHGLLYPYTLPILLVVFLSILIVSIKLVFGFEKKDSSNNDPVWIQKEGGIIAISANAFENMANHTLKQISDIKDYKVTVKKSSQDIKLFITLCVAPEINIPAICDHIQKEVLAFIYNSTGVKIESVNIKVEKLSHLVNNPSKSRVE